MDNNTIEALLLVLVIAIPAVIFGGKYLVEYWHQPTRRNNILKAQFHLLCKIAEKQGVDIKEIEKAFQHAAGFKTLK
jgi:hypothetical protein